MAGWEGDSKKTEPLSFLQLFLNQLQIMPACFLKFFIFKKKPRVEGWHDKYPVSEFVSAKIVKIIEAATQLKK